MTKQELLKILDEKIDSLERERARVSDKYFYKTGQIDAYTDIKNLLENEGLENV